VTWDLRSAAGTVSGTTGNDAEAGREPHTMTTAASTEKEREIFRSTLDLMIQ